MFKDEQINEGYLDENPCTSQLCVEKCFKFKPFSLLFMLLKGQSL